MIAQGKLKHVEVTAIARELAGFVWATLAKIPPAQWVECQRRGLPDHVGSANNGDSKQQAPVIMPTQSGPEKSLSTLPPPARA
jgi:hypothetical protein